MKRRTFNKGIQASLLSLGLAPIQSMQATSQTLKTPAALNPKDKVGLIAPAGPVAAEKVANAITNMQNLGLEPVYNDIALKKLGYFSASDQERLDDLHQMFANKEIKAIWCLRGGFGCTRILPLINYDLIRKNPKVFIGYSDITALHHAFYKEAGLKTYHGPVASSQIFSAFTSKNLQQVFFSSQKEIVVSPYEQEDESYRQPALTLYSGQAEGKLTGGNLTLLSALAGTSFAPRFKNKIVFIEEIGEKPYRIDRMFTQLLQATDIKKANGIIFGIFHDCQPKMEENSFKLIETIQNFVDHIKIPAIYGFPIGHIPDMVTLPMDATAILDADHNHVIYKL
jgi:muramoyltetrapeptide carboxypeptidase